MTDAQIGILASAITGGLSALALFLRWAVGVWATVRREDILSTKETAAAQRADAARIDEAQRADGAVMRQALVEQAKSNIAVMGAIREVVLKIDTLVEWRERTPVEGYPVPAPDEHPSERRRIRTAPQGYRPPRPGDHHDE